MLIISKSLGDTWAVCYPIESLCSSPSPFCCVVVFVVLIIVISSSSLFIYIKSLCRVFLCALWVIHTFKYNGRLFDQMRTSGLFLVVFFILREILTVHLNCSLLPLMIRIYDLSLGSSGRVGPPRRLVSGNERIRAHLVNRIISNRLQ